MGWRYWYKNDDGDLVEFTDRVQVGWAERPGTQGLVMMADEGAVGNCSIDVEDPDGDWDFPRGHRIMYVQEEDAGYDDFDGIVFMGYTAARRFKRDVFRTGAARIISIDLVDINTVFDRRIMVGAENNRPAETDVERIAWLLTTNEAALIDDAFYFSTDGPVDMDAVDYRGQSFRNILDDCSLQSGKNWYLWASTAGFSLWYQPRGTEDFTSTARISNVIEDLDDYEDTYAPAIDSEMTRDPSRVYSGIYRAYSNSYLYTQNETTATDFARRDTFASSPNVKTKVKAMVRNERELFDISTEEDVIATSIMVPRSQVNDVVAGQRVLVRYSHFPGLEEMTWLRVLERTVRELSPANVEISMKLSADEPAADTGGIGDVFGILRRTTAYDAYEDVWYDWVGDNPSDGAGIQPTVGLIHALTDPDFVLAPRTQFYGFEIDGTGTIDVTFYTSTIGVTPTGVTFSIRLNGVDVAAIYQVNSGVGNDGFVSIEGLPVVPGDVITAGVVATPQGVPFFRAPRGTGDNAEGLTIVRGVVV